MNTKVSYQRDVTVATANSLGVGATFGVCKDQRRSALLVDAPSMPLPANGWTSRNSAVGPGTETLDTIRTRPPLALSPLRSVDRLRPPLTTNTNGRGVATPLVGFVPLRRMKFGEASQPGDTASR